MNTVLVGAQWGDEGKGKVIDFLTEESDVVVRFQGGSNAGHTVVFTPSDPKTTPEDFKKALSVTHLAELVR